MNRVVVTGLGIVSCIGNNQSDVIDSLKNLKSGITSAEEYEEFSFRSLVHGKPNIDISNKIDRRLLRFMGDGAAYNYIAMKDAIDDSGLEDSDISNEMTGIIVGSGGPSTQNLFKSSEIGKISGSKKLDHLWYQERCLAQILQLLQLLLKLKELIIQLLQHVLQVHIVLVMRMN